MKLSSNKNPEMFQATYSPPRSVRLISLTHHSGQIDMNTEKSLTNLANETQTFHKEII